LALAEAGANPNLRPGQRGWAKDKNRVYRPWELERGEPIAPPSSALRARSAREERDEPQKGRNDGSDEQPLDNEAEPNKERDEQGEQNEKQHSLSPPSASG
jgi:hypothetical protein